MSSTAPNRLVVADNATLPRFRIIGDVTLDLFHRDGRVDDKWLGFHPREFELLWRLSEAPGERVTKKQLLTEVWRIDFVNPDVASFYVDATTVEVKAVKTGLWRTLFTAKSWLSGARLGAQ